MIVGTRGSKLAITQTKTVVKALEEITGEEIETKIIKTILQEDKLNERASGKRNNIRRKG